MVTLAGMYPGVPGEVTRGSEGALAYLADMLLLWESGMEGRGGRGGIFGVEGLLGRMKMGRGREVRVIGGRVRHVLSVRT